MQVGNVVQSTTGWTSHTVCMGQKWTQSFDRKPEGKRPLGRPNVDRRIILGLISKK
jgi:hypothetical protein